MPSHEHSSLASWKEDALKEKSHTTHPFDLGHEQVITFLYKKAKEEYSSLGAPSTLRIFFPYIVLTNLCFLWEEKKREPVSAQEKFRHM